MYTVLYVYIRTPGAHTIYTQTHTRMYVSILCSLLSLFHTHTLAHMHIALCRKYSWLLLKDLLILWWSSSLTVVLCVLCVWIPQFFMNFLLNWSQSKWQVKRSQSYCSNPYMLHRRWLTWEPNKVFMEILLKMLVGFNRLWESFDPAIQFSSLLRGPRGWLSEKFS